MPAAAACCCCVSERMRRSATCCTTCAAIAPRWAPCSDRALPSPSRGPHPMIWGVLLAGGSGTRFWPLSTPSRPKQLLPLAGRVSTAEAAAERLDGFIPRERLLVVMGEKLAGPLRERLALPHANMLVEPR